MFEAIRAAFDAIALLIEFATVYLLDFAASAARNHGDCAQAFDLGGDGGRVVALIGEHDFGMAAFEQMDGFAILPSLSCREAEGDRIAFAVGQQWIW